MNELAIRVHEPGDVAPDVRALQDWIRRHEGVFEVEHRETTGHIVIRYDERRGTGRFLEGIILDRLRANRPAMQRAPQPVELAIAHELPGRVRFKVTATQANALERLSAFEDNDGGSEALTKLAD